MGSKSIIFVGTLVSGAFLYYSIYKSSTPNLISSMVDKNDAQQVQTKIEPKVEPEPKVEVKKEVKASTEVASAVPAKEKEEAVKAEEVTERISIPAFGFMSSKNKNQIVALMSDNEKDGKLSKYIKWVCSKKECIKDIRFESNIMDSSWQDGAVKIIELFENGSISNGSLFIESDTLKLEGKVNSQKVQNKLTAILKSLESTKLKIKSYTKLVESPKPEKIKPKQEPKVEKIKAPEIEKVETPEIEKVETPEIEKVETPEIEKVDSVSEPIIKETAKPVAVSKPIVKPVSKPETVPAPFMETTLDAPAVLETKLKSEPIVDVVKPVLVTSSVVETLDAQKQLNNILETEAIVFEGTGNLVSEKSKSTLKKLIKLINTFDNQEIKVSGFTDFSSDKVYNKVLSQKRADTVTRYLKNNGIKSKHIKSIGYGDVKPGSADGVAIEIEILTGETK